jgi:glycosyltransferase involved in cell wall biosynthesis
MIPALGTYFAIVTCRNSEKDIEEALQSLRSQTVTPLYVIVIDDGSKDGTPEVLKEMQQGWKDLYVITNPDLGYDIGRVVSNWNKAIKFARDRGLPAADYHMISTDDTIYDRDYAEKILRFMDASPQVAIVSGNYEGQDVATPHGAGRFVRSLFFNRRHGLYPEKMGYESLVLHTTMQEGYTFAVVNEARFVHSRPLGKNHHFYEFGASMRTLGYHPLFALGRFAIYFFTGRPIGRAGDMYMLYHYVSYKPKTEGYDSMHDEEIRRYIRGHQLRRIRKKLGA